MVTKHFKNKLKLDAKLAEILNKTDKKEQNTYYQTYQIITTERWLETKAHGIKS